MPWEPWLHTPELREHDEEHDLRDRTLLVNVFRQDPGDPEEARQWVCNLIGPDPQSPES